LRGGGGGSGAAAPRPAAYRLRFRGGARGGNNLKDVIGWIFRADALRSVLYRRVRGSGKSSLAFGTLYAEAQRRYLESVVAVRAPAVRPDAVPEVDEIDGLPPRVALQQQRGSPTTRSSVGSVTTLSNLLRMLYSRAGDYPRGQRMLYAESFSPNTPEGAVPSATARARLRRSPSSRWCPTRRCTIRERASPRGRRRGRAEPARHPRHAGIDVDVPWRELPKKTRDWILFTDEQPTVPVYAGSRRTRQARAEAQGEPSYMGTFTGARAHVLHTFATTQSAMMKKRVMQYMTRAECRTARQAAAPRVASVTFAGSTSPRCRACR
jgi:excinuclease ABC subunit A